MPAGVTVGKLFVDAIFAKQSYVVFIASVPESAVVVILK